MFVTEFGGPYQSSGLRPISIAMFDLIYAGKFERQYLENGKEYKGIGFNAVRQLYLAIDADKIYGLHCPTLSAICPQSSDLPQSNVFFVFFRHFRMQI